MLFFILYRLKSLIESFQITHNLDEFIYFFVEYKKKIGKKLNGKIKNLHTRNHVSICGNLVI